VGAVHLGWLLLGAVWAAAAIEQAARRRDGRFAMAAALLLAPLSYALSYLPATIAPDFRYLYPATVTAQAVSLPLLAAWAWRRARDLARALRLLRPAGPARA
jgi:hypothetical protein